MHFDRLDICAAYHMYASLWGHDTYTYGINARLRRIHYSPGFGGLKFEHMSENAREIYGALECRNQRLYVGYNRLARRGKLPGWPGTAHMLGGPRLWLSNVGLLAAVESRVP